jgi:hypothetical protein
MAGWMCKKASGFSLKTWKKRFFVYTPQHKTMQYFESAGRTNVKGTFVVTGITIEPVNSAGEHRFTTKGLRGPGDATLFVKIDTEHAVKAWVDFIQVSLSPAVKSIVATTAGKASKLTSSKSCAKFCSMLEFGDIDIFQGGLSGFLQEEDMQRSIEEECRTNDGMDWSVDPPTLTSRMYEKDYEYVCCEKAVEREEKDDATGATKVKDKGHDGWTLKMFCGLKEARHAGLKLCHVIVVRLYTGRLYGPWNAALRALLSKDEKEINVQLLRSWGTCVAVLAEAIMLLSKETPRMMVMRGVNESIRALPSQFIDPDIAPGSKGFAGGVEMGFMSTTADLKTANGSKQGCECTTILDVARGGRVSLLTAHLSGLHPQQQENGRRWQDVSEGARNGIHQPSGLP